MKRKRAVEVLFFASLVAVLLSLFLLYQHYSKEASGFCNFGELLNCDVVNKGEYSTVDGVVNLVLDNVLGGHHYLYFPVPNAAVSVVVFLFFFGAAMRLYRGRSYFGMGERMVVRVLGLLIGLSWVYALILIYIEWRVLQSWCVFCLALDVVMLVIAYAVISLWRRR